MPATRKRGSRRKAKAILPKNKAAKNKKSQDVVAEERKNKLMKAFNLNPEFANIKMNTDWSYNYMNLKQGPRVKLEDLPHFVLHDIFENINIWHQNRLRFVSSHISLAHEDYLISRFRTLRNYSQNEQRVICDTLFHATSAYWEIGVYRRILSGLLLELFRDHYRGVLDPRACKLKQILYHFYDLTESQNERLKIHGRHLVFLCTVCRILKCLYKCSLEFLDLPEPFPDRGKIHIRAEICGRVFRFNPKPNKDKLLSCMHNQFLAMLAEGVIEFSASERSCRHSLVGSNLLRYGVVVVPSQRFCIDISMEGGKDLKDLIVKCCTEDEMIWPDIWPEFDTQPIINVTNIINANSFNTLMISFQSKAARSS